MTFQSVAAVPSGQAAPPGSEPPPGHVDAVPGLVLDTNVVLDWLLFDNPGVRPLVQAIEGRAVRWLASSAMADELVHVLGRSLLQSWHPDQAAMQATWGCWAESVATAAPLPAALGLRCRDTDDQKFIDLAVHAGARWLVSRDRAVLALARRARALGLVICTPERWPGLSG